VAARRPGIIRSSSEVEALASSVPDNGGVYFVPAFVGLGAPHWDSYARGAIFGLTRGSTAGHIARAASRASPTRSPTCMDAVQTRHRHTPLEELRVDGGASANDSLMQFQATFSACPWCVPHDRNHRARRRVSGGSGRRILERDRGIFWLAGPTPIRAPHATLSSERTARAMERSRLPGKRLEHLRP
jgi:hypothetical protein